MSIPTNGLIVANKDNNGVFDLIGKYNGSSKIVLYGHNNADYIYKDVIQTNNGLRFNITYDGNEYKI